MDPRGSPWGLLESERPKGIVGCQNHGVEGHAASVCVGAGSLLGHPGWSHSCLCLGKSGHGPLFKPCPAGPGQSRFQIIEETYFWDKERKERNVIFLKKKETAYLGYFHKMAQDFCPYF